MHRIEWLLSPRMQSLLPGYSPDEDFSHQAHLLVKDLLTFCLRTELLHRSDIPKAETLQQMQESPCHLFGRVDLEFTAAFSFLDDRAKKFQFRLGKCLE